MENETKPYKTCYPGDAITAQDCNDVQVMIKEDIAAQTQAAVDGIQKVPEAGNADKLENMTLDDLKELMEAFCEKPARTGYQQLFKILKLGEENVIEHGLTASPLVDIYQLEYFPVVATEDDFRFLTWVNFFLYHSSEKRLRFKEEEADTSTMVSVDIEPRDGHAYRIPFQDMLDLYEVEYTPSSSLGDLETEFWQKFCSAPNDEFDDDQHAHSPWFDRCCREHRSIESLKKKGNWDDIWFQMRPRKTVNYPFDPNGTSGTPDPDEERMPAPTQIGVYHFDFNTLGLKLLRNPVRPPEWGLHPDELEKPIAEREDNIITEIPENVLKVMVLLKV